MTRPASAPPPLAAACGLFCGACGVHLATKGDPAKLSALAARLGQSVEDTRCAGCRTDQRSKHCRSCTLAACAEQRGHRFCAECGDYPCAEFRAFQAAMPHRRDIPRDMVRILEIGPETWLKEAEARHACPACGVLNSAYDLTCRACGHAPGSAFAADHGVAIRAHLEGRP